MIFILWQIINKYSNSTPLKTIFWMLHANEGSSLELSKVQHPDSNGEGGAGGGSIAMYIHQLPPEKIAVSRTSEAIPTLASA